MYDTFKEAFDAFSTLADDETVDGQARYEAAELYLLTTPPQSLDDAIFALRCLVSSLAAGGRTDGLDIGQSARVEQAMLGRLAA